MKAVAAATLVGGAVWLAGCGDRTAPISEPGPSPAPVVQPVQAADPLEPRSHATLDDFPLLDGYPTDDQAEGDGYGREGPSRDLAPLEPSACGQTVRLPDVVDRLRGGWSNIEDFRQRQLALFSEVSEAQDYAERVLGTFRACPVDQVDEHSRVLTVVERGTAGDWSGVAVSRDEYDGMPTTGMVTTQVVRVGRAVLVAIEYGEGGAVQDAVARGIRWSTAAINGVVQAMAGIGDHPTEPPFGPDGFGAITFGMSRDELLALPGVRITGSNDQCEFFDAGPVSGAIQPGFGVADLYINADIETPEGVHIGSTFAEVQQAYGDLGDDRQVNGAAVPGYTDRHYRFEFGPDGRLSAMQLRHERQHCAS